MRLFRFIMFAMFLIIPISAKSEKWEVLRGINYFTNATSVWDSQNFTVDDTLCAYDIRKGKLWKYIDRKWSAKNDLRKDLLDACSDTTLINIVNHPKFMINHIDYDKNKDMWLSCSIQTGIGLSSKTCYLLRKTKSGISKHEKFYRTDSNRYEAITDIANVSFDNNNVPYVLCSSVFTSITENKNIYINNILKIENDSFRLIKSLPTETLTLDNKGVIRFDSKNNFWLANVSSLYYFVGDTLSRRFGIGIDDYDLPQDYNDIVNVGAFVNIFLDKADNLTAVSNSDAIYTFSNNAWSLDTTASAFIRAVKLASSMALTAETVQMDTMGNLWLAPQVFPWIMHRDATGKWSYNLIPYTYFSHQCPLGDSSGQIILLKNGELWMLSSNFTACNDSFIYTPKEN